MMFEPVSTRETNGEAWVNIARAYDLCRDILRNREGMSPERIARHAESLRAYAERALAALPEGTEAEQGQEYVAKEAGRFDARRRMPGDPRLRD